MLATTNGSESEMGSLREDTVPLLLPKNSRAFRFGGKKTARSPCCAQSAANRRICSSIPARLSPSCTKVSLHRLDSRRSRHGSLHNLPPGFQKDRRSKTRRPHHRRVQSAAEKIWRRSVASVHVATRRDENRRNPRHGHAVHRLPVERTASP